jgi:hypothetical protein
MMIWPFTGPFANDWIAPRMRSPIADLLADLGAAFAAVEVEWFLFGAQAAIVYGVARLTGDVDVTARVPARLPNAALAEALEQRGFRLRFDDPAFIEHSRVLPFVHEGTGLPVDVVLSGPGLEDEFFARVGRHLLDGVDVPVVDVSDLIVMKVLAGRPKDVEDVVTLLRVQEASVELTRVRRTLQMLESALAQSDLMPALDQARARARSGGR